MNHAQLIGRLIDAMNSELIDGFYTRYKDESKEDFELDYLIRDKFCMIAEELFAKILSSYLPIDESRDFDEILKDCKEKFAGVFSAEPENRIKSMLEKIPLNKNFCPENQVEYYIIPKDRIEENTFFRPKNIGVSLSVPTRYLGNKIFELQSVIIVNEADYEEMLPVITHEKTHKDSTPNVVNASLDDEHMLCIEEKSGIEFSYTNDNGVKRKNSTANELLTIIKAQKEMKRFGRQDYKRSDVENLGLISHMNCICCSSIGDLLEKAYSGTKDDYEKFVEEFDKRVDGKGSWDRMSQLLDQCVENQVNANRNNEELSDLDKDIRSELYMINFKFIQNDKQERLLNRLGLKGKLDIKLRSPRDYCVKEGYRGE